MKPSEQYFFIQVPVYVNQQIVEVLWLCRPCTDKRFTHALQKRQDAEITYADSGQSSLLIANAKGDIVYLGAGAQWLLT